MMVTIFNGGRGAKTIFDALISKDRFKITSIVNAYDDGKSTGEIRKFFDMLGPSDIRKTQSHLLDKKNPLYELFIEFFNYRLPHNVNHKNAIHLIKNIFILKKRFFNLDEDIKQKIKLFLSIFLENLKKNELSKNIKFNFSDCSIMNCVYAGAYKYFNNNLYRSITEINSLFKIKHKVLPNSLTNLKLVAIRENGEILFNESEIVNLRSNKKINKIYLIDYKVDLKFNLIKLQTDEQKKNYIESLNKDVEFFKDAKLLLQNTDLIIFAPGTQHSSLLPSYTTKDLSSTLINNSKAYKVLIVNIGADFENPVYIASEYIKNSTRYLNLSSNLNHPPERYFDLVIINSPNKFKVNYVRADLTEIDKLNVNFIEDNFEDKNKPGSHNGQKVLKTIMNHLKIE